MNGVHQFFRGKRTACGTVTDFGILAINAAQRTPEKEDGACAVLCRISDGSSQRCGAILAIIM